MSTPPFLLLSLAAGFALLGALWLVGRAGEPLWGVEARRRRLQHRLERRLARGDDRYFEELRSIRYDIETNEKQAAAPWHSWRRWPLAALAPFAVLYFGMALVAIGLRWFDLGAPPEWTSRINSGWTLVLLGLPWVLDPAGTGLASRRATRVAGAVFVTLGGLLAYQLWFLR